MKTSPLIVLACLSTLFMATPCYAQIGAAKGHDERVEKLLDSTDIKYMIDDDGDFKMINELETGRTHVVFINSATEKYHNLEIREVWSLGFISDGQLSPEIMRILLKQNQTMKWGSWKILEMGGKETAVYYAQIAADSDKNTVLLAVRLVSEAADEMEEQLTKKDDM